MKCPFCRKDTFTVVYITRDVAKASCPNCDITLTATLVRCPRCGLPFKKSDAITKVGTEYLHDSCRRTH